VTTFQHVQSKLEKMENENLDSFIEKYMDKETPEIKWNRGLDLFIESVYKPDHELRQCSHNQKCYNELMAVRENVLEYLKTLRR
jgi:hypothetical protein